MTADEFLACGVDDHGRALLPGDAIFVQNDVLIGICSDIDHEIGWKYHEGDLDVGQIWSMQLVPMLADDILLHVRAGAVRDLEPLYGSFPNTVSVDYLIDQGEQTVFDESGAEIARTRSTWSTASRTHPGSAPCTASSERCGRGSMHCRSRGWPSTCSTS